MQTKLGTEGPQKVLWWGFTKLQVSWCCSGRQLPSTMSSTTFQFDLLQRTRCPSSASTAGKTEKGVGALGEVARDGRCLHGWLRLACSPVVQGQLNPPSGGVAIGTACLTCLRSAGEQQPEAWEISVWGCGLCQSHMVSEKYELKEFLSLP